MTFRRSERLIDMTNFLVENPSKLIPLTFFSEKYGVAKSSVSEDLVIIKDIFEKRGTGTMISYAGAAGGVKYIVDMKKNKAVKWISEICELIALPERILPGGFLYLNDILGNPQILQKIGKLIATRFVDQEIDAIMTIATKGIPIAYAVAQQLNIPVVIVRRNPLVTEGSTVSINYLSASTKKIQTMVLSRRSLPAQSKVLIVDDFMKAGGTIGGMINLLKEFEAEVKGIAVFIEADDHEKKLVTDYLSLIRIGEINEQEQVIQVNQGRY